jgi:uncharacterized membrane protein YraQ (UPF0718 family)
MHLLFRREEAARTAVAAAVAAPPAPARRSLGQEAACFAAMVGVLVFANWSRPEGAPGVTSAVFGAKWIVTAGFAGVLGISVARWFTRAELAGWLEATWGFARQILPLLFLGVLAAGVLLGRPGHEALVPSAWVERLVGGDSLGAVLTAAIAGAFMYFATLTEVPIVQGLIGSGMGKGAALALLLAGPALSLPSILAIRSILGNRKTAVYCALVVVMATAAGWIYGALLG